MTAVLHIDFETASEADLPVVGLDNYTRHPSTKVHCLGFVFGDDEVSLIADIGGALTDCPELFEHIERGGEVVAHNAPFELAIWNNVCVPKYGWPRLKPEQMRCTMAQCYAMGLPASLEKAAPALGIAETKDMAGSRVMMQLARTKPDGALWSYADNPEKFERLFDYCRQDVAVERELDKRLMKLSPKEREVWLLDRKINERGIRVDVSAINSAIWLVNAEKQRLDAEMLSVTNGEVGRCTEVQALVKWIKKQGVALESVGKADVLDALNTTSLPENVREALNIRREAAKSSTAKLAAMRDRAGRDTHRVNDSFQYHGATTGRWAHRGVQPGNLPRPRPDIKPDHIEDIIKNIADRDYIDIYYGPVMAAMADCVRGMITADKGCELIAVDFSAVEARVLAWLAGEEKVLDIFRTHGKIYEHAAAGIYGKPIDGVTKDERQIGKVAVLALGFGGGVGAFQSMARVYGVNVDDQRADEIKTKWRSSHPKIVQYWRELETAAIDAIDADTTTFAGHPGREVAFRREGSFLWCKLPSGRVLCYPYPMIRQTPTPWGEPRSALHYHAVSLGNHWEETSTYGGSLAENVTQAVARDLLAEAMLSLDAAGHRIVMHVHDEIVVEVSREAPADTLKKIEKIVATPPSWAKDLPLAAEGWRGFRYRK
jgi:DNA polymerase